MQAPKAEVPVINDDVQPIEEHNEVVEEEFHGGNKKKKSTAVRSAPPRKQHHEPELAVEENHEPVVKQKQPEVVQVVHHDLDAIPTISDHVEEVV